MGRRGGQGASSREPGGDGVGGPGPGALPWRRLGRGHEAERRPPLQVSRSRLTPPPRGEAWREGGPPNFLHLT